MFFFFYFNLGPRALVLTSLSRTSVNVQVFPGTHTSGIQYYQSHNSIAGSECRFSANAILKDCTDEGCLPGTKNSFYVRGRYSGSWGYEREGEAFPLRANRKLHINQTRLFLLISFAVPLLVFIFTATDTIQENERTATSITIAFTPIPGATGYEIVARSAYAGAFSGSCDDEVKPFEDLLSITISPKHSDSAVESNSSQNSDSKTFFIIPVTGNFINLVKKFAHREFGRACARSSIMLMLASSKTTFLQNCDEV